MPRKNQIIYNIAIWILIVLAVSTTVINCVSIFYNTFSPPALTLEESKLINDPVREKLNNILREKQSRQDILMSSSSLKSIAIREAKMDCKYR